MVFQAVVASKSRRFMLPKTQDFLDTLCDGLMRDAIRRKPKAEGSRALTDQWVVPRMLSLAKSHPSRFTADIVCKSCRGGYLLVISSSNPGRGAVSCETRRCSCSVLSLLTRRRHVPTIYHVTNIATIDCIGTTTETFAYLYAGM